MDSRDIVRYLGIIFLVVNTILFFKSYRKKSIAFKIFSFYLLLTLIIQALSAYYFEIKKSNLYLSHYYFIGQFILLSLLYKLILKKALQKIIITFTLIMVLIVLSIYYYFHPSNYFKFNIFEIILTSVPIIIYCFFFFTQKIEDLDKKFIYITSGLFLYILCSTLLFTLSNIRIGAPIKKIVWDINVYLYLFYQSLIFIEWYKNFKRKSSITNNNN